MPHVYTSNPDLTARRREEMERYLATNVLEPERKQFVCGFANRCKASHHGQFYEGQLHHLGRHYDLAVDGRPLRIVVVGQECGHNPIHVAMDQRWNTVLMESGLHRRFYAGGGYRNRNSHMKGTTSVLRLLLGLGLGSNFRDETPQINDKHQHIFDAFALVNFLLCSAVRADAPEPTEAVNSDNPAPAGEGMSTGEMQHNCSGHFRRCLEILKPNVIVVQGRGVRDWMGPALGLPPTHGTTIDPEIERVRVNNSVALLVAFSHPSARDFRWGTNDHTPYLINTVTPKIQIIRSMIKLA